jgi:D-inositol-3-phosphate glycosyltransferase
MRQRFEMFEDDVRRQPSAKLSNSSMSDARPPIAVTLLTGGGDKDYVFGLATELLAEGIALDLIGSDELDRPEFHGKPGLTFLNLRGNQSSGASLFKKVTRVLAYYLRLLRYAATAKPKVFHILWNNKFEVLDRTLLLLYYKLVGKQIVFTAHNVNAGRRDRRNTLLNRVTLRTQYRLVDHIFAHTEKMKTELMEEFQVQEARITVIPYGINNALPNTALSASEAKRRLGVREDQKSLLFFGNIRPYKGLEYLVEAFQRIRLHGDDYRLFIVGKPQQGEKYWNSIQESIREDVQRGRVLVKADFVPDEEAEVYFKAADVFVLPYKHIYQSGVLFLGYSFGLPALAADVGSLRDEIVEGQTGFVFRSEDSVDLASTIERYFASELFADLNRRRGKIREFAMERHSWEIVGRLTVNVYASLLGISSAKGLTNREPSASTLNMNASS